MTYTDAGYFATALTEPQQVASVCTGVPPGAIIARGALPPGILMIRGFLTPQACRRILDYADGREGVAATVQDVDASADQPRAQRSDIRVTDYVDIAGIETELIELMRNAFENEIAGYYGRRIEWFERPAILRYRPGGHYVPHADAENWDKSAKTWTRSVDRDFSLLLYLDEDYRGGELEFPNFRFRMKPQAGMLMAFPSDHRYVHAAAKLETGKRHVIVSWAAAHDSERVLDAPPAEAVHL